jgi:hypothetical protein
MFGISSVGKTIGYETEGRDSIPGKDDLIYRFSMVFGPKQCPTDAPNQCVSGALSPE